MPNPVTLTIVYGIPVLYAALQYAALVLLRGRWRWAAAIPLLGWALWSAIPEMDGAREFPTYNHPPIEAQIEELLFGVFYGSLAGTIFLGLLFMLQRMSPRAAEHR